MKQLKNDITELSQETEIPEIVRQRTMETLKMIREDNEVKETRKNAGKKRMNKVVKAASAAAIAVLAVGTTAFASTKVFGLDDYFASWNTEIPEEAKSLVADDVSQENKKEEIVDFKVREYLCDSNQMYFVIEAKAVEADKYLLITQDILPDDPVEDLQIEGVTNGTVADYAKEQGKELLVVGASVDTGAGGASINFHLEEDGTGVFIYTTANEQKKKKATLICNTCVYPLGIKDDNEIMRDSFKFDVEDKSNEKTYAYKVVDSSGADAAGIAINDIQVSETELGQHFEISYKEKDQHEDLILQVLGEDGKELSSKGVAEIGYLETLEDGTKKQVRNYEKTNLSKTLKMRVIDEITKEEFGTIIVERNK